MKQPNLRAFFFFLFFSLTFVVFTQDRKFIVSGLGKKPVYLHYTKKVKGKKVARKEPLKLQDILSLESEITINPGCTLAVADLVSKSVHPIKPIKIEESGTYTLAEFLDSNCSWKDSFWKVYFGGFIAKLFKEKMDYFEWFAATVRGIPGNNSITDNDSIKADIHAVLNGSTTNMPEEYVTFLEKVLEDIESQNKVQTDSITE